MEARKYTGLEGLNGQQRHHLGLQYAAKALLRAIEARNTAISPYTRWCPRRKLVGSVDRLHI